MQLTDPDFIEMLDDSSNLDDEEFESLFGKSFLFRVVKEAEEEEPPWGVPTPQRTISTELHAVGKELHWRIFRFTSTIFIEPKFCQ